MWNMWGTMRCENKIYSRSVKERDHMWPMGMTERVMLSGY